jgi:surface polysaccharide O-acyltransferase-like enzyme
MKQRQTELDILRFLATLAVIMTHVCGGTVKAIPVTTPTWMFLNSCRAAVTWDVPIFVMISGRFFLDESRAITMKDIFGKYLKRLILAFVVWSAVYQAYYVIHSAITGAGYLNIKGILSEWITGAYHLWYLYMLAGLYILTPFLRKIAQDKKLTEYFLILFVVSQFVTNYAVAIPKVGEIISTVLGITYFHFTLGYAGYFLLGYYLYRYGVPEKWEKPLYALGIMLVVFSAVATTLHSRYEGAPNAWFSTYQMPNIIIESAALYTFFVKRVSKLQFSQRCRAFFAQMTELGFGVYLVHALIIDLIALTGLTVKILPVLTVPLLTAVVLMLSLILTKLIRSIPRVGKLIT